MAGVARKLILGLGLLTACVACADGSGATTGSSKAGPCRGADLSGSFAVVLHSAGAGNITYDLSLRNRSTAACTVTGLPAVVLHGAGGRRLPTHVRAAYPGRLAVLVTLRPGRKTHATARFSPDVPGVGEGAPGPCEPKAYRLVVAAPGGGTVTVPVVPPTPVCEHGQLQFSNYLR
ncbi:MAG: DUF4232 domain-containing protein [Gaiellaceae bacterium]